MEIFQSFGLDIKLLIANFVNFVLLVAILYKLGYKPILHFVNERQKKIEKGVTDAEAAGRKMKESEEAHKEITGAAHKEAQEIIGKAREQAELQAKDIMVKTAKEAKTIVAHAKKEILEQQEQSKTAVKREAAALVVSLAEKLVRKKMDAKTDRMFVDESLKELK